MAIFDNKPASAHSSGLSSPLVLFGGTFDPVHFGHLRAALEIRERLAVSDVRLLPCHIPAHRDQPSSTAEHRIQMIRLAIACDQGETGLTLDTRECEHPHTSYTVSTLQSLRKEYGDTKPIILTLGMDAFNALPRWHQWQELLRLAHLLVVQRPDTPLSRDSQIQALLTQYQLFTKDDLTRTSHGGLWIEPITPLAISATNIRKQISLGHSARYLLPDVVWQYIKQQGLYGYQVPGLLKND